VPVSAQYNGCTDSTTTVKYLSSRQINFSDFIVASDGGKKEEADPYRLGTTFAISLAGGLRFVPGGRLQIRADAGTYLYQIKYPSQYYVVASDGTAVLDIKQAKNFWKRNGAFTLGVSYLLFR